MATKLAPGQVSDLDPYMFMAVIGKRVIHPGGRASTAALLRRAQITDSARVLDIGCGWRLPRSRSPAVTARGLPRRTSPR